MYKDNGPNNELNLNAVVNLPNVLSTALITSIHAIFVRKLFWYSCCFQSTQDLLHVVLWTPCLSVLVSRAHVCSSHLKGLRVVWKEGTTHLCPSAYPFCFPDCTSISCTAWHYLSWHQAGEHSAGQRWTSSAHRLWAQQGNAARRGEVAWGSLQ